MWCGVKVCKVVGWAVNLSLRCIVTEWCKGVQSGGMGC